MKFKIQSLNDFSIIEVDSDDDLHELYNKIYEECIIYGEINMSIIEESKEK